MVKKGKIQQFAVENINARLLSVVLDITPDGEPDAVKVMITGTLNELCTKLNAIPFKGKPVIYHLKSAECFIKETDNEYAFVSVAENFTA